MSRGGRKNEGSLRWMGKGNIKQLLNYSDSVAVNAVITTHSELDSGNCTSRRMQKTWKGYIEEWWSSWDTCFIMNGGGHSLVKVKLRWHFQTVIKPSLDTIFHELNENIWEKVSHIQNQIIQSCWLKENQVTVS